MAFLNLVSQQKYLSHIIELGKNKIRMNKLDDAKKNYEYIFHTSFVIKG